MVEFKKRVLLLEDDEFLGSLIEQLLNSRGFSTRRFSSAISAKRAVSVFDPDAALVDVMLGDGPSGLDFVHFLSKRHPTITPLLISQHPNPAEVGGGSFFIPAGVAYLRKGRISDADYLVNAINDALIGHGEKFRHDRDGAGRLSALTRSQREVLRLMAQGFSNSEIAKYRETSISATEQMITAIFRALALDSNSAVVPRVEAIRLYIAEAGLPERPENITSRTLIE